MDKLKMNATKENAFRWLHFSMLAAIVILLFLLFSVNRYQFLVSDAKIGGGMFRVDKYTGGLCSWNWVTRQCIQTYSR